MPAELDREEGYERRENPDGRYDKEGPVLRHPGLVVQRISDVDVTIQADGTEVHNRSGRAHDVRGHPDVAHGPSEHPATKDVIDEGESHHHERNEQISHGQRYDEIVTCLSKMAVSQDGKDDESVSGQRQEYEGR